MPGVPGSNYLGNVYLLTIILESHKKELQFLPFILQFLAGALQCLGRTSEADLAKEALLVLPERVVGDPGKKIKTQLLEIVPNFYRDSWN